MAWAGLASVCTVSTQGRRWHGLGLCVLIGGLDTGHQTTRHRTPCPLSLTMCLCACMGMAWGSMWPVCRGRHGMGMVWLGMCGLCMGSAGESYGRAGHGVDHGHTPGTTGPPICRLPCVLIIRPLYNRLLETGENSRFASRNKNQKRHTGDSRVFLISSLWGAKNVSVNKFERFRTIVN